MKKITCCKCGRVFDMPDDFSGTILCENCDPVMKESEQYKMATPIQKAFYNGYDNGYFEGCKSHIPVLLEAVKTIKGWTLLHSYDKKRRHELCLELKSVINKANI